MFSENDTPNPYAEAIKEIGIGAFPLLPNSNISWLKDFLIEQFGLAEETDDYCKEKSADYFYVKEAARITYTGMELSRYQDLSLAVALGDKRDKAYLERFRQGKAEWYHLPLQTTTSKNIQRNAMREIQHCAFVVYHPEDSGRRIEYSYEVISVQLHKRKNISKDQAGAEVNPKNEEKEYWLFELGRATQLNLSIDVSGARDFKFRLVSIDELAKAKNWTDLSNHYAFLHGGVKSIVHSILIKFNGS